MTASVRCRAQSDFELPDHASEEDGKGELLLRIE